MSEFDNAFNIVKRCCDGYDKKCPAMMKLRIKNTLSDLLAVVSRKIGDTCSPEAGCECSDAIDEVFNKLKEEKK